jgi:hypothetical protein
MRYKWKQKRAPKKPLMNAKVDIEQKENRQLVESVCEMVQVSGDDGACDDDNDDDDAT